MKRKTSAEKMVPYEHLKHFVRHTTPEQRLKWLEEAQKFVRSAKARQVLRGF